MKFKNYLESITGVGIYPMISLVIFFVFFACLAFWALRSSKQYISYMKNIPISKDEK
jgi:hypothetical protein